MAQNNPHPPAMYIPLSEQEMTNVENWLRRVGADPKDYIHADLPDYLADVVNATEKK